MSNFQLYLFSTVSLRVSHYAKDAGNYGRNSNGNMRFDFFRPECIKGMISGGGPLISVGIFRPKFAVPFLRNRFFALIREFGKCRKSSKSHSC